MMVQEANLERILISEEELAARVRELGQAITRDYADKDLLIIGVLRGSFMFMSDLVRQIDRPAVVDFLYASSYGGGTMSSGDVRLLLNLKEDLAGRHVLIVEDILDSGNTLHKLTEILWARKPETMKICVLLDKPSRREKAVKADYVGFTVPDEFVVGYGLDYDQHYRTLPMIGILKPSVYR